MADRYDPNSGTNLDKFDNAGDPSSDTWATLVTHITGYPVPDRSTVFDTLRSDHGGKLFRMDIKERSLGLLVKDSGFLTNKGEDYDIWFFDSGKKRSIMQARIVFEGRVKAGDEVLFADINADRVEDAQVREGNEFTDYNKDKMSTIPLARYMNGPRTALLELLGGGTQNARFSNLGVGGGDAVDLNSFNTTGESFDFAAKFFKDHATVLKDWEDRFGRDDASWKGEAAEVFRSLLKKVRENYDAYVETFNSEVTGGGTGQTVYSRALSVGRQYLEESARKLLEAWMSWAKSPYYDPHRVLRYVLDDLAQWVDTNNVAKTEITSTTTRYSTTVRHSPQAGFSQTHPEYGDLTDIANWAKVGDKAVKIWSQGVDEYLGKPAAQVQSDLNNHFLDLSKDFSENVPKPKSTGTASEEYEEKKLEEEKEEINRQNEENRKYQDELREEQERQREEDRKYQEELREEQRQQREEDKKYQDELREEQERQREEDKKYQDELRNEANQQKEEEQKLQDELRNEANQQREEDKKYQDELREEQNQQREEDKKYQDELREEQRREQEEAKREAEEQAKAVEESLGGINDPNSVAEQTLGNLDDLLNQNNAVTTESLGDLGDVNGQNGDDRQAFTGDGAPLTQTLGGLGALGGGPGGTNNSANDALTQSLGNLGGLNNGTGGSGLKTPTGGSTQLDGGRLTTDFPDGSSTSFDPDSGVLTTTHPDGSVTTQNLGDGLKVTNPDGSVTSLGDDGKLTTTFPDGTSQTVDPTTGQATTTNPDGTTTTTDLGNLGNLNGSLGG
ncbi:AAWKG family protein, partial [Streptomyces griseoloalbus]